MSQIFNQAKHLFTRIDNLYCIFEHLPLDAALRITCIIQRDERIGLHLALALNMIGQSTSLFIVVLCVLTILIQRRRGIACNSIHPLSLSSCNVRYPAHWMLRSDICSKVVLCYTVPCSYFVIYDIFRLLYK